MNYSYQVTLNQRAFRVISHDWQRRVENVAAEGAQQLGENISLGTRSGRKWSNLPNRSSRASQFSQEQGGKIRGGQFVPHIAMRDAVGTRPLKAPGYEAFAGFGFYQHDLGKLLSQEFGNATMRGRRNLDRTARSRRFRAQAKQVVIQ